MLDAVLLLGGLERVEMVVSIRQSLPWLDRGQSICLI